MKKSGTFFVVGTPIGNLKDITLRAIEVLTQVQLILCEDTRVTKKLLAHYHIVQPTATFHAHSQHRIFERILSDLEEGKDIALVSDAGMPGVSDPGERLVAFIRERSPEISIVSIPGPSAVLSALSVSGIPSSEFVFLGFLPHKKGRNTRLAEIADSKRVIVFYESVHRIEKTLYALKESIPERYAVVSRELTKLHEESVSGSMEYLYEYFKKHPDHIRGEFTIVVSPKK